MIGIASGVTSSCDITNKLVSNKGSVIFDGTNDFVDCGLPTGSSFISKTQGSISLWARITAASNNEMLWNCCVDSSGTNKINLLYNSSGQKVQAQLKVAGVTKAANFSRSNSNIIADGWFHVCMTYEISDTAYVIKLYYNGTLETTKAEEIDHRYASDVVLNNVQLGKNAVATNTYHQGYIDEYAYFTRVLTDDEVSDIHAAKGFFNYAEDLTLTGTSNELIQWLRFGDGGAGGLSDVTTGIVDMSDGSLGDELITNGGFDADSDWTKNTGWSISGGVASSDGSQSDTSNLVQINTFDTSTLITDFYLIRYTVTVNTGSISFGSGSLGQSHTSSGTYYIIGSPQTGSGNTNFTAGATFTGTVDNVSVRKINGNNAQGDGVLINQSNLPG